MPSFSGAQNILQRPSISYCWTPPHLKTVYQDYDDLKHQFIAILLPSGVAWESDHDIRMGMAVYNKTDYYLNLEIQWPDAFEKANGEKFLNFLKAKKLRRKIKKWLDIKKAEQVQLKQVFDAT